MKISNKIFEAMFPIVNNPLSYMRYSKGVSKGTMDKIDAKAIENTHRCAKDLSNHIDQQIIEYYKSK